MLDCGVLEIAKTLIERLISWPVAALVLAIVFRKSIARLIDRIDKGKFAGIEVSTKAAVDQIVNANAAPGADQLSSLVQAQTVPPPNDPDFDAKRAIVMNYGGDQPLVLQTMQSIAATLEALGFTAQTPETAPLLVRHLAVTQIMQAREFIYRLIFGSQIAALKLLMNGPATADRLRSLYDKAVAASPEYFASYTYDQWLAFLVQVQLIQPVQQPENGFEITLLGREFLNWLFVTGLSDKAH